MPGMLVLVFGGSRERKCRLALPHMVRLVCGHCARVSAEAAGRGEEKEGAEQGVVKKKEGVESEQETEQLDSSESRLDTRTYVLVLTSQEEQPSQASPSSKTQHLPYD